MSIAKKGLSAIGKLVALGVLAAAFFTGMAGVVYMSLQGKEIQVPDITGKDLAQADKELAGLGLKIKKRADRASQETPGTVIEELPKPGDIVKTGQMIMVVTSRGPENGTPPPPTVKSDEDDSSKIEDMISDKPKKAKNANTNKKKPDTTRDVNTATADTNSGSTGTGAESNSNKSEKSPSNSSEKPKPSASPASSPKKPDGKTVDSKLKKKP